MKMGHNQENLILVLISYFEGKLMEVGVGDSGHTAPRRGGDRASVSLHICLQGTLFKDSSLVTLTYLVMVGSTTIEPMPPPRDLSLLVFS